MQKDPNYFIIGNNIIFINGAKIGPYGIAVYCALKRHSDHHMDDCAPSYSTLARLLRIDHRMVMSIIEHLCGCDLVIIQGYENEYFDEFGRSSFAFVVDQCDQRYKENEYFSLRNECLDHLAVCFGCHGIAVYTALKMAAQGRAACGVSPKDIAAWVGIKQHESPDIHTIISFLEKAQLIRVEKTARGSNTFWFLDPPDRRFVEAANLVTFPQNHDLFLARMKGIDMAENPKMKNEYGPRAIKYIWENKDYFFMRLYDCFNGKEYDVRARQLLRDLMEYPGYEPFACFWFRSRSSLDLISYQVEQWDIKKQEIKKKTDPVCAECRPNSRYENAS